MESRNLRLTFCRSASQLRNVTQHFEKGNLSDDRQEKPKIDKEGKRRTKVQNAIDSNTTNGDGWIQLAILSSSQPKRSNSEKQNTGSAHVFVYWIHIRRYVEIAN